MSVFTKQIIEHPILYIAAFSRSEHLPWLIFVHGGPGLNASILEYLIEHEFFFSGLEFNIILYDQRGCGRSRAPHNPVLHADNIHDLDDVCKIMEQELSYDIAAIIGHSYGAKILFDYYQNKLVKIPGIFVSTASSILIPRINNLLLDLAWLKQIDINKYQEILNEFDGLNYEKLWELTEQLTHVFESNINRPYYYWANLEWKIKVQKIQEKLCLPINNAIFNGVRKDLYSQPENYLIDIAALNIPSLCIKGFHDYVINGAQENKESVTFYKSSHYPHIEENIRFTELVNHFLKDIRSQYEK